jgi:hypothetical protein
MNQNWLERLGFLSDMNIYNELIHILKNQLDPKLNSSSLIKIANSESGLFLFKSFSLDNCLSLLSSQAFLANRALLFIF